MSNFSGQINQYFIDMISDPATKVALSDRLKQQPEERSSNYPNSNNNLDAIYVVIGCMFQDSPLRLIFSALMFIIAIGYILSNLIMTLMS